MKALGLLMLAGLTAVSAMGTELAPAERLGEIRQYGTLRGDAEPIYSCTTGVAGYGGQGVGVWAFDDLQLDRSNVAEPEATRLSTLKFSIFYGAQAPAGSVLTGAALEFAFYQDDLINAPNTPNTPLLSTFSYEIPEGDINLAPGQAVSVTVDLLAVGIEVDTADWTSFGDTVFAGLMFNEVYGTADPTRVGQVIAPDADLGYSEDWFFEAPLPTGPPVGDWIWFGGNPEASLCWELTVPEPGPALVLMLALLLCRRR